MDPAVIRQTYVRVDIPLSVLASRSYDDRPLTHFSIPVFDGRDLDVEILRHEGTDDAGGSFVGRVAGKPGSFVILGYDGEAESGTVQIPDEGYILAISYAGEGLLRLSQLDPHKIPGCGKPAPVDPAH